MYWYFTSKKKKNKKKITNLWGKEKKKGFTVKVTGLGLFAKYIESTSTYTQI